jgi:hypothetical protein
MSVAVPEFGILTTDFTDYTDLMRRRWEEPEQEFTKKNSEAKTLCPYLQKSV